MNIHRCLTIAAVSSLLFTAQPAQAAVAAPISGAMLARGVQVAAYDDFYKTLENTELEVLPMGVLQNDEAYWQGTRLTAELVTAPTYGKVILHSNGAFLYLPLADFVGVDTFTYQARMGNTTAQATVLIEVTAPNPVLAANDDDYKTLAGMILNAQAPGVLANDTGGFELVVDIVTYPKTGKLALDTTGAFTYIPPAGFVGVDTFVYSISDGKRTSLARVTIYVLKNDGTRISKPRK